MRQVPVIAAAIACLIAACSGSAPSTFAVTSASVDPTYWCPGGANNLAYDLHATVNVRNGTSRTVAIESMTAEMKLASVHGSWLEKVGDRYDAGSVTFAPSTVDAASSSALKVTIPSACTSDKYGAGAASYGDYAVTVHLVTSAGAFSVTAQNQHEIRTA